MKIALISSTQDPASENIKAQLLKNYSFETSSELFDSNAILKTTINKKEITLYTINSSLIHAEDIDYKIEADVFVFLSKHRAEEGRASVTLHPIGNFGKAEFGGKDQSLCACPSALLKDIFIELKKNIENTRYEATLEATHHGPFIEKPVLFLELGSTEEHWHDGEGALIVAKSLLSALEKEEKKYESVIVLGGTHYGHVPNKAMLETEYSVGHICPKYNFSNLSEQLLLEMVEKTEPKPSFVLLDWKGLGSEKQKIVEMLEKNKIEYKRSDQLFK